MARKKIIHFALSFIVSLSLLACEEEEVEKEEVLPALGILELPVSLRTGDTTPTDAHTVEITPQALRVNDELVIKMDNAKLPDGELANGILTKLKAKLNSPTRTRIALHLHASVQYAAVAAVLNTANSVGIRNATFKVRNPGGGDSTGWLELNNFKTTPRTVELVEFPSVPARPWNDFANVWEAVYRGCRGAASRNCAYKQDNVAVGGKVNIVLLSAGQGVNIDFFRVGLTEEDLAADKKAEGERTKPQLIDGLIGATDPAQEYVDSPPATEAKFQFRSKEAVLAPSAITDTMAPMCGKSACGVIVAAENVTMIVRVIQLIGAAFPDDTTSPTVAFTLPWTEKPKATREERGLKPLEPKEGADGHSQ